MTPKYHIELLGKHDRTSFDSGVEPLDRYLREGAAQDMRRRVASCFVACDDTGAIAAYYTIAATALLLDRLPPEYAKRLPRYPLVSAVLLGRLAVARDYQGQRLGGALVADALLRATRVEAMAYAMVVDAKDESAVRFYRHLGFVALEEEGRTLFRRL